MHLNHATSTPYLRKSQGQDPRKDKNPEGLLREVIFSDPLRMLWLIMEDKEVQCNLINMLSPQSNCTTVQQ